MMNFARNDDTKHNARVGYRVVMHTHTRINTVFTVFYYGVASISRLLKSICLFAKEPYKRDDILQNY